MSTGLHVLCEKPLANTLDEARLMVEAAKEFPQLVNAIGFMKGHYPLWLEAARRLQSGLDRRAASLPRHRIPQQVLSPKKGWTFTKDRSGGGILINSGIHLIQFLHILFGDVARVTALARPMHSTVEDTLCALMQFKSGIFGSYDTSWSVPGFQTEGTFVLVEGDDGVMEITDDWLRTYHLTGKSEKMQAGTPALQEPARATSAEGLVLNAPERIRQSRVQSKPDYGGEGYYNEIADFAGARFARSERRGMIGRKDYVFRKSWMPCIAPLRRKRRWCLNNR